MAEAPERPVLAKAKGTFRVVRVEPRKLLNGNKLHVVLEAEMDPDLAREMLPLFDKDVSAAFKEKAVQRTDKEKASGQLELDEEDDEIPEDETVGA